MQKGGEQCLGLFVMVVTAVAYLVNSKIGALLLLLAAAYYLLATKGSIYDRLLKLIVYSTPYYTFDLFGGRQRLSLCIVAIAFFCVLLTFNMVKRGAIITKASAYRLILMTLFLGSYILSVFNSYEPLEMIFATYQLVLITYLLFILPTSKNEELKAVNTESLIRLLIRGVCAITITLYVQYIAKTYFGVQLGEVYEFNSKRVIYNVYFNSKSVLSLYISIGILYFFIEYIEKKKNLFLIVIAFFCGAFLINNSRTGLACFALLALIYSIKHFKDIVGNMKVVISLVLIFVAGVYVIQLMLNTRTNLESFTDDNGRFDTIIEALRLLPNHIFSGIGGSANDYILSSMGVSVHNFLIAYLIQFGLMGGLAVNIILLIPVFDYDNKYWYLISSIILGGMFFANWHNALYIVPLYLCDSFESKR